MVDLILKDGLIVTMDGQRRIIKDGIIVVDEGKIIEIGKTVELGNKYKADKIIDAKGKILMPGLICSHTHLYGMLLAGAPLKIIPPSDFSQILQRVWWPMDEAMTQEDAYASALMACLAFLKTGTTCFADTYSGPESIENCLDYIAKALKEVGIRGILAFEATERHSIEDGEKGIQENVRFIKKIKERGNEGKVMGMFSIHASFTCSDDMMKKVRKLAKDYKVPITIHTSEGLVDVFHNLEKYGKRTVERLKDIGLLGPDVVLAHCVNVNKDEIKIIKETKAKVAHNPMSNMLNAVGVAPINSLINEGITVGLGNDGYIFDHFENMRTAFLLHRVHNKDPRATNPEMILEMATMNGAKLYELDREIGSLEIGKNADIILINPKLSPTPIIPESVCAHLINTTSGKDVETVIVNGELLMEDREVKTVDEERVVEISREAAESLWKKLGAS
ncbi:MAG: amidohydrolase family protein [Candidatus Bathyarchaeia archaeon]